MIKNYLSLVLFLFSFCFSFGQTTIYSEDFSGQNGKGAIGPIPQTYSNGVPWTIDISATTLNVTDDYFIVDNEAFEAQDTDGAAIWLTPTIDISAFTNIQFSLEASQSGVMEITDTFTTEYSIDGGAWTTATNNGNLSDDFISATVSDTGLNGNTIQLRVTANNNANGEVHTFDNVLIEGTAPVVASVVLNSTVVSNMGYVENENSVIENTFTVEGFNLTNDITLTAPANFEISTTAGAGFGNAITLTQTAGVVPFTTLYVRLANGLVANNYSGNLVATSAGVANQNITLEGIVTVATASCSELIISEYHEAATGGNSNEKYIELYNPTNANIDLTNYQLTSYVNGNVVPNTALSLAGYTINAYSSFTISRNGSTFCDAGTADLCTGNTILNFNGNDAIALQTSAGLNIDIVGNIGSNANYAANTVLRRNIDVSVPTLTYDSSQWTEIASNDLTDLGSHFSTCICPSVTVWDGTNWDNGLPDINKAAIINNDYDTSAGGNETSFTSCLLVINAGFTLDIQDNTFIEVQNDIIANGDINVSTAGSVVQNDDLGTVTGNGNIKVVKTTAFMNTAFEYTYWSSPTANTTIDNGLTDGNPIRRFSFNGANFLDATAETGNNNATVAGQDDIDDNGDDWTLVSGSDLMIPGVGYASTHRPDIFLFPGGYDYDFDGPFNNGVITVPVYRNDSELGDNNWNFIGNPYPSAVDITPFFNQNSQASNPTTGAIDGDIHFWSHDTPEDANNNGNEPLNFTVADYATINSTGTTSGNASNPPDPFIPSGQGFFVSMSDSAIPTSTTGDISESEVVFNNAMRVTGNNSQFFRNTTSYNKLWINLTSDNGVTSQILIGYVPGASEEYDGKSFDSPRNMSTGVYASLSSLIANNDNKFVIQGKAISDLTTDEIINLNLETSIDVPTIYNISIQQFEGEFMNTQPILLKDNLLNTIHDLKESDYAFTSEAGVFNNRFEIVFNAQVLSVDENEINDDQLVISELNNGKVEFTLNSIHQMVNIEILDLLGRTIYNLEAKNSKETTYNLEKLTQSVYIAKVTLSNGQTIIKKALKRY